MMYNVVNMETKFKRGDIVRAKRAFFKKILHFPILRSEIMIVTDVHEIQYSGDSFKSIGVSVQDINGKELLFSQKNLEKI